MALYIDKDNVFLFLVTARVQCSGNEGNGEGVREDIGDGPCFGQHEPCSCKSTVYSTLINECDLIIG